MCFIFLINFIVGYNLESIFNTRLMNRFSKIFNSIFLTNDNAAFIYVKIVLFKRIVSREMIYFRYFVKNDMSRYSLLLKFSKNYTVVECIILCILQNVQSGQKGIILAMPSPKYSREKYNVPFVTEKAVN